MNILILFYLLILLVICGHIIFGKERTLNYPHSKIEGIIRVRHFTNVVGVVLYVENTLISYSEVQAVQNYETHAMSGFRKLFLWNKILWDGC